MMKTILQAMDMGMILMHVPTHQIHWHFRSISLIKQQGTIFWGHFRVSSKFSRHLENLALTLEGVCEKGGEDSDRADTADRVTAHLDLGRESARIQGRDTADGRPSDLKERRPEFGSVVGRPPVAATVVGEVRRGDDDGALIEQSGNRPGELGADRQVRIGPDGALYLADEAYRG